MDSEKLEKLKEVLLDNSNVNFLSYFKTVQKFYPRTDINGFISSFKTKGMQCPSAEEARNFFKKLESLGVGRLQRYGSVYKFDWKRPYSMANMKDVADGKELTVKDVVPYESNEHKEFKPSNVSDNIVHEFMLRPNLKIKLDLPKDFNSSEAERLQSFIKTLPF